MLLRWFFSLVWFVVFFKKDDAKRDSVCGCGSVQGSVEDRMGAWCCRTGTGHAFPGMGVWQKTVGKET